MVEAYTSVDSVAQEWDDLAERTNAPPFLRPGWIREWLRAFRKTSPVVVAARRGGRLVGVLPLIARGDVLESATNWHTPEFGAICEDEQAVDDLLAAVLARRPRRVSLWFLNGDGGLVQASSAAAAAAGYRRALHVLERSPYVSIDGDWSAYENARPAKMRSDLRRRRRLLEQEGALVTEVADGSEHLGSLLEDGFLVESSGWKAEAGTAIVSQPETLQFYTDVARWLAERGWLRLNFLRSEGRPIAFEYGIEHGGVYYLLKGGYDPEYSRFAPAKLLIRALLERSFTHGLKRFDFGGAEEAFKLEWANGHRDLVQFEAFAPSALGMLDRAAVPVRRYGPHAVRRLRAAVRR